MSPGRRRGGDGEGAASVRNRTTWATSDQDNYAIWKAIRGALLELRRGEPKEDERVN